jgi:LuxR family transcriptional regulator, maltose regulon positive regulatory protein
LTDIETPRASSRADVGAPSSFGLSGPKLAIPAIRSGAVPRARLVERLTESAATPVVSVTAPAGYGKTTLLAMWAERDARPFAWISVDERDNDPVLLLNHIAAALDRIAPIDPTVFKALSSNVHSVWPRAVPRLGAALWSIERPLVLVLDDLHELTSRECVDAVATLSWHLPDGSQLAVAGRGDYGLPISRLRADGRLLELGPEELALSAGEARALLRAAGVELSEVEAEALNERTEGWAAGLYLAALSLQAGSSAPAGPRSFSGDDRFVTDYLRSEHLQGLPAARVRFLTRTSILGELNSALCDAVLGRTDSARTLEAVEATNQFLVPLNHRREWYRYHHLYREMLRSELARREPDTVAALNGRAADWCEANDLHESAIDYAAAAGDEDRVARLVAALALPYYRSGRVATVEAWFDRFDDTALLRRYPVVGALGVWVHALRGRATQAERWTDAIETAADVGQLPDGSPSLTPWIAMLRALLCRAGVDRMRADAELAVAELGASSQWRVQANLLLGTALLLQGEPDRADAILADTTEDAARAGAVYGGVVALGERALLALDRGEPEQAEAHLLRAWGLVDTDVLGEYVPTAVLLAADARLALARGDLRQAREDLARAHRLRPQLTYAIPWFAAQTRLELARVHLALRDAAGAKTLLSEVAEILRHRPDLGVLGPQARRLRHDISTLGEPEDNWAASLTAAELRLLPLLTTHLSFREIAERLFVSRNTVKTQAISVYRKLGVSSRSEAIRRATELGLVDAPAVAEHGSFTLSG